MRGFYPAIVRALCGCLPFDFFFFYSFMTYLWWLEEKLSKLGALNSVRLRTWRWRHCWLKSSRLECEGGSPSWSVSSSRWLGWWKGHHGLDGLGGRG
ncbi:hypothetical protein SLA2020_225150 [Shorea laevis]